MGACRFGDAECAKDAFCWQGNCLPDQPNGESCTAAGACQSGNCQNGVCCSEGDCCESDAQCPAVKTCDDTVMCQGKSQLRHCDTGQGVCVNDEIVDDDSGCGGRPSTRECGRNLAPLCGMAEEQADAPACVRCTNLPRCVETIQKVITVPSGTTTVPMCVSYVSDIPVGCELGATCNSATGVCR
jgi:hypothetical protein